MILGKSSATGIKEIAIEYKAFIHKYNSKLSERVMRESFAVPLILYRKIQKKPTDWTEDDIIRQKNLVSKTVRTRYMSFYAFLVFRGIVSINIKKQIELKCSYTRYYQSAFLDIKELIKSSYRYKKLRSGDGQILAGCMRFLILVLAYCKVALQDLTRKHFDNFYYNFHKIATLGKRYTVEPRLVKLGVILADLRIIDNRMKRKIPLHERRMGEVDNSRFVNVIRDYLKTLGATKKESTVRSRRASLIKFFLWLNKNYPEINLLSRVNRPVGLSYIYYTKQLVEDEIIGQHYGADMLNGVRLFFEFIKEDYRDSPKHNPIRMNDISRGMKTIVNCYSDFEIRKILSELTKSSLKIKFLIILLLHTGIRISEAVEIKATDFKEVQKNNVLHIRNGKGNKERMVPLTPKCLSLAKEYIRDFKEPGTQYLFTYFNKRVTSATLRSYVTKYGKKIGMKLIPHRFRHTFAVALINYGIKESVLQKIMGHETLSMTLEYGKVLDKTVQSSFEKAVNHMKDNPKFTVPNFFVPSELVAFSPEESSNMIRLPYGYCRRNTMLHCESDVKCLLCERFVPGKGDGAILDEMYYRFTKLELTSKAEIIDSIRKQLACVNCE